MNFHRFLVARVLINPSTSINIMSLDTSVYLQIDTYKLERNQMVLKIFNEYGEKALRSITLTFNVDN